MDQANRLREMMNDEVNRMKQSILKDPTLKAPADVNAPRVIAVTSGKGGVGKTNIVGNLAMAMSQMGRKVMIFDADLGLANIDIIFGLNPQYNIGHVVRGEKALREVIIEGPGGVRIIPASSGLENLTHLTEGQKLNLLGEFESLEEDFDVFLVDTSAGISSNVIYFNLAADECLVVATAEPTSITDAYALMKVMGTRHGLKYFKLLINMVKSEDEAKAVYRNLSQAVDRFLHDVILDYVGFVPFDEHIRRSVLQRRPVMQLYPESNVGRMFTKLAGGLLKAPRRNDTDGNIKFFLKRFMQYQYGTGS